MPPELGAGAVGLPDPIPVAGAVGLVVLPLELEPEPLVLLPEAPLPALEPLRASRSHLSLSAPVRATHLLALLPDAPEAAEPDEPEVELSLLPEDEPLADGAVVLLLPEEPALPELPMLPDEPAPALPEAPEAPEPLLPEPEPEDCEKATPDSARSAAAVAAVRVFNIMEDLLRWVGRNCAVLHASSMPPLRKRAAGACGQRRVARNAPSCRDVGYRKRPVTGT